MTLEPWSIHTAEDATSHVNAREQAKALARSNPSQAARADHARKKTPAQLQREIDEALAGRHTSGGKRSKRSHATMETEKSGPRILARWESRTGKHWVELTQHAGVTIANAMDPTSVGGRAFTWYGYTSPGSSGTLAATTSAAATAEMEQRVNRGDFLPDAAKTPMKRVR